MSVPRRGRVVLLVLDGVGPEIVVPDITPTLWRLAETGGIAPVGGLAELVASTGPNHATLLTGAPLAVHGVLANRVFDEQGRTVNDPQVQVPTILTRARVGGRPCALIASDPDIIVTVRGEEADLCWPDRAQRAADSPKYVPDARTVDRLVTALDEEYGLVVAQLQEADSAAHLDGIDGELAVDAYRRLDRAVAHVVEALRPAWEETLLVIVSDHRSENLVHDEPVRLAEALAGWANVIEDGSAALVRPVPGAHQEVMWRALACEGVDGIGALDHEHLVAWAQPGRAFGREGPIRLRAVHGNVTTRPCLTLVAGGHPIVASLAALIRRSPPPLRLWAGVAGEVLGV